MCSRWAVPACHARHAGGLAHDPPVCAHLRRLQGALVHHHRRPAAARGVCLKRGAPTSPMQPGQHRRWRRSMATADPASAPRVNRLNGWYHLPHGQQRFGVSSRAIQEEWVQATERLAHLPEKARTVPPSGGRTQTTSSWQRTHAAFAALARPSPDCGQERTSHLHPIRRAGSGQRHLLLPFPAFPIAPPPCGVLHLRAPTAAWRIARTHLIA